MQHRILKSLQAFKSNKRGAVAVESAMISASVMIFSLAAADMGIAVNDGQKLNASVRSGVQYLMVGGHDKETIKSIIANNFGGATSPNVVVSTFCSCPNFGAVTETESRDYMMTAVDSSTIEPQYTERSAPYTLYENTGLVCQVRCSDYSRARTLVQLDVTYVTDGIFRPYAHTDRISIRVN